MMSGFGHFLGGFTSAREFCLVKGPKSLNIIIQLVSHPLTTSHFTTNFSDCITPVIWSPNGSEMQPEDQNGGQAPSKPGPKNVDWAAAKTLYLNGMSKAEVARAVGCSREHLSRVANDNRWDDSKALVRTESLRRTDVQAVEDRVQRLSDIDRRVGKLLELFDRVIAAENKRKKPRIFVAKEA